VFLYGFDVPAGTTSLRLPSHPQLRILAITAVSEPRPVAPARALYMPAIPRR
jgi:hypothetical protein